MKPRVLNKKRDTTPPGAVFIGRPSKWGNPFIIGLDGDRNEVIEMHRAFVLARPKLVALIKKQLRGKTLVCFCRPKRCHGDTLLEIANAE